MRHYQLAYAGLYDMGMEARRLKNLRSVNGTVILMDGTLHMHHDPSTNSNLMESETVNFYLLTAQWARKFINFTEYFFFEFYGKYSKINLFDFMSFLAWTYFLACHGRIGYPNLGISDVPWTNGFKRQIEQGFSSLFVNFLPLFDDFLK